MLNRLEIAALKGIQAREREVQEKHIKPIQDDLNEILQDIQVRLQVQDPGFEFGKTHLLDLGTLTLTPVPPQPDQGAKVMS